VDRGLPVSGDVVAYLASVDYDPQMSKACPEPRQAARTGVAIPGDTASAARLAACVSRCTGPEFGTRESRHIDSVRQLKWKEVMASAHALTGSLGTWGCECMTA